MDRWHIPDCFGDASPRAISGAMGLMVNDRYKLDDVERNHERFISEGKVMAAPAVMGLLSPRQPGLSGALRKLPDTIM